MRFINLIKPELFFVTLASFFGLIFLFITPPFQTPDEINHFYRAYQISEGNLIAVKQDNRIGGYMPTSLINITDSFINLRFDMHAKTNYNTIIEKLKTPLEPDKKTFTDFTNTGMYSPVSYIPQALSIFILRILNLPPLYIFYGARIFVLFFWIFFIFLSIKIIPFYKWLFALMALLPMSLFTNMSLSADVVTNLLCFVAIAYFLRLIFSEQNISIKKFLIALLLAILLALSKMVYIPIVLLFFLIPKRKFKNNITYFIQLVILYTISFGCILLWSNIMNSLYLPYSLYNEQFRDATGTLNECADMHKQMQYILTHGIYIWQVFINSMTIAFNMYFEGYIGTLGWLDTKLPMWFIYLSYAILVIVALTDRNKEINIKLYHKIIFFFSLIIMICLVLLSQHLTWNCVGGGAVYTIQGRYFIPAFALFFLLFYNSKINYSKIAAPIVIAFPFISLAFTTNVLHTRYYVPSEFETTTIKCGAENLASVNFFETNIPSITLDNANTQSREKARSGIFSAKLSAKKQFGFTYRMNDCKLGDVINIDVWRYGTNGNLILNGGNIFYFDQPNPIERDSTGWDHLQINFTVSENMTNKEVGIYLFYDSQKDSSYFDDMSITYKKFIP